MNNNPTGRGFGHPVDLTVGQDGRIFVLNRHALLARVGVCTLEEEYLGEFASYGHGDGQFWLPTAIAIDRRENIYVADEFHHNITVFDCIHKFTAGGKHLLQWGEGGTGEGQFDLPWGVTLDSEGNVYVADWRNDRIQKFSPEGQFMAAFGESGDGDGQFNRPAKPAVDSQGYIYVADWGNERVQVLGPDGSFQLKLRGAATVSKWAQEFLDVNPDESLTRDQSNLIPDLPSHLDTPYLVSTQTEPYFWGPTSVNLDAQGRLYVTESSRHRVQIYQK